MEMPVRTPHHESREPRAESREPRAESREPRAESREPRAESRTPAPRHPGTPAPRHPGTPAPRHPGTPAPRHPGTPAPRHPGTPAPRHPGTPAPRHPGTPAPRHPGTPAPRHPLAFCPSTFSAACLWCGRTLLDLLAFLSAVLRSVFAASQNPLHPHHGRKLAVIACSALLLLTGRNARAQVPVEAVPSWSRPRLRTTLSCT